MFTACPMVIGSDFREKRNVMYKRPSFGHTRFDLEKLAKPNYFHTAK